MATGTIILRPSSDISISHTLSSGSSAYALIADEVQDGDSTYISQALTTNAASNTSSLFGMNGTIPSSNITVTNTRIHVCGSIGNNSETGSYFCYFDGNNPNTDEDINKGISAVLTNSYRADTVTRPALTERINELIETTGNFPTITMLVRTSGAKASGKNAANGYIRLTQVYVEFDYETVETSKKIYTKVNNSWKEYSKVYKKVNNVWVEQTDLSSVFDPNINYILRS